MNHGLSKDGAILNTIHSEEHTLSKTYRAIDPNPLTVEDVIRSAKKQPKFTYNTVASDLLVFSITLIVIVFAGGLIVSAALLPIKATVEQLSRELPVYPE